MNRIVNPIVHGKYPQIMRNLVGKRLPEFTKEEAKMVKGSIDFLGVNYYSARYADDVTFTSSVNLSYMTDSRANQTSKFFQF